MSEPVRLVWELKTTAAIEAAWALLSDTDRFNRVAGFGFQFEERPRADGTIERVGRVDRLGLRITWDEQPWTFRAPEHFRLERRFHGGPAEKVTTELRLTSIEGGTAIRYEVALHPRNWLTRAVVAFDAHTATRPQLDRALREAVATLDGTSDRWDAPPPLDASARALVDEGCGRLPIGEGLRDALLTMPLVDQDRLRPLALAARWRVGEDTAIAGCLQAVREGLLALRWELLCPSCRGAKASLDALGAPVQVHCPTCNITYDGTFPDNVEVVFRPTPAVRRIDARVDCLLSPGRTPHVAAQVALGAGAEWSDRVRLAPGGWWVGTPGAFAFVEAVEGDAPTAAAVDLRPDGARPASVRVRAGDVDLSVRSRLDRGALVVVQQRWRPPDALTAGRLLSDPAAVALLPPEALAAGAAIETSRRGILVATGSRDLPALIERLRRGGASVYTGDDVVIATWDRFVEALAAAERVSADEQVAVAVGLGPVVQVAGVPSGPGVDAALRALRTAGLARIVLPADLRGDPDVAAVLAAVTERVTADPPLGGVVGLRFPAAERARRQGIVDRRKQARDPEAFAGLYRLGAPIAEGGFGKVVEAVEIGTGQTVAVKILLPDVASDPLAVQLFYNEARVVTRLTSPHVVRVYDYGEAPDTRLYLAMERLVGRELEQVLKERRLDAEGARRLGVEILTALEEAHARGVIHRDLKPANVFLCRRDGRDDFAKVIDFGIARTVDAEPADVRDHALGTPLYMSPEQLDQQPADARSDLYAVGLVLYEALAGRLPWEAPNARGVVYKRLASPPQPLSDLVDVPAPLADAILRALALRPEDRWPDAASMRAALQT